MRKNIKMFFWGVLILGVISIFISKYVQTNAVDASPVASWTELWTAIEVTERKPMPFIRAAIGEAWTTPTWGSWEEISYDEYSALKAECVVLVESTIESGSPFSQCMGDPLFVFSEQAYRHILISSCNIGGTDTDHWYNSSNPCAANCETCSVCDTGEEQVTVYSNTVNNKKIKKVVQRNKVCVYKTGYYVYAYYPKYYKTSSTGTQTQEFSYPPTVTCWEIEGTVGP